MDRSPIDELCTPEAIRHHWRVVRVERWGWAVLLLLVVGALLGLLGPGPLSTSRAVGPDGTVQVAYERFLRSGTPTAVVVTVDVRDPEEPVRLLLDSDHLDGFTIEEVRPAPVEAVGRQDAVEFVFAAPGTTGRFTATFALRVDAFGRRSGVVEHAGGDAVSLTHWIFP